MGTEGQPVTTTDIQREIDRTVRYYATKDYVYRLVLAGATTTAGFIIGILEYVK